MLGFRGGSAGEESACSAGDLGLIPGLGRAPGEGKGYPLQYSGMNVHLLKAKWSFSELITGLHDFMFSCGSNSAQSTKMIHIS